MTSLPILGGVELLHARYVTQIFSRHFHDGYAVGCIEQGAMRFRYQGQNLVASGGQVNLVVPGEAHDGHGAAPDGWAYRMFYLRPETLAEVAGALMTRPGLPDFRMGVIDDPVLAAAISRTHRLLESPDTSTLEKETRLMAMLAGWISRWAEERGRLAGPGREHRAVARAREIIQAGYGGDLSLAGLAREAGLSPFHLVRVFERETGVTPHAYLTQVRVQRARQRLAGAERIADIAVECGFADQAHLTRLFKRQTGMTPGNFRKNLQNSPLRRG
ncbi:MAG: AraC family transcriptional regulator [Pseudodesulfovibrio sp.]|nr:AraC family transcriptional regulator [Pseudomonadota bacterium]MBV1763393.1 AraC family transcriptional regulator [Pseudodesulfovibrio sp.]MBU4243162.1 AraC family transcriptional regulator [Pseudomonadota bacterium]MBU4378169.1 AraC family transcriptional regulator [Pseudomonadota bacterium]MBU4475645.1 AraC family transcriptional regulator [Pseudomonadota bacterium]